MLPARLLLGTPLSATSARYPGSGVVRGSSFLGITLARRVAVEWTVYSLLQLHVIVT